MRKNFFGDIINITAIVGDNGSGKIDRSKFRKILVGLSGSD